jgi:PAS domain S-box-containing protein
LHFAPLSLLVICEILLFFAERHTQVPPWVHIVVVTLLAAFVLGLSLAISRREERVMSGLRREITGMQQEMAKSTRRYKSLLEGAGNAIFVFSAETGMLEEVNRKGMELLGFSQEELSRMQGKDLLHAADHERFRSFVYHLKRHGRAEAELTFQGKDGTLFLCEINGRLIDLGDEQVAHCILRDITEKRRTEREVWQRNRELSILNNILTGMNRGPGLHDVRQETLREIMELFQAGGGTVHLIGGAGDPAELAVALQVSPHLEKLLRASLTVQPDRFLELRVIQDDAQEPLFREAAAERWGCVTSIPLTVQKNLIGVMHLMHGAPHPYAAEELRFLESVGNQIANVIEKNRLFSELNRKSAELLRSHRLLEKTSHNLSASEIKLKRNLALVEQANQELNRLDRMKNQFLGMVSHEFNTPLTSIIAGAEHLLHQTGRSGDDSNEVLGMVRDGGLRLKELVADLLKLIRLEARHDRLETSAVHLRRFLEGMTEQLKPQLDRRRQTIKLTDLEQVPFFDVDQECLERVFGELLLNAIKYGPEGGEIEICGEVLDREALSRQQETLDRFNPGFLRRCGDRCYVQVAVRDQGAGVPVEEQQGIFEIFYEIGDIRHHSSGTSRHQGKGAGLGLAMVKGMVEAHGGMVWVDNREGSAFFLILPMEQEATQPALF